MINSFKNQYLSLIFTVNALLYGLVYFFSYNSYGEPQIPVVIKLALDLLLVIFILLSGFKNKLNLAETVLLVFLFVVLILGFGHSFHTSFTDFLHYSVRNVIFYSSIFFVQIFNDKNYKYFNKFHYKIFKIVLVFGFTLFILTVLGIKNPFGFHYWLWEKNRLISTWLNPNSYGFYLLFYLIYEYYLKNGITIISIITIFSIFLTGSITAISGLALVLLIFFIKFLLKNKIKPYYIILFLLSIPISIFVAIYIGVFDYLIFKINVLFIDSSSNYTSVSTRVQNVIDLYNYLSFDNTLSIIFGDFSASLYNRLDSQYLNIFYNYGLLGLLFFFLFQVIVLIKLYNGRTIYSKVMFIFSIWLFLVAYNLTAYMYRSNISIFYYIMLSFILFIEKRDYLIVKFEN